MTNLESQKDKVVFRKVTSKDITEIMKIERECFHKNIAENEETIIERINVYNEGFLVALIANEIIGYISSEIWDFNEVIDPNFVKLNHSITEVHIKDGTELYISSLGVLNKYQGLGLGSLMFNHLINQHLKMNRNIKSVVLLTANEFSNAMAMYKKQGFEILFEIESVFHFDKNNYQNGIVMRKFY